MSLRKLDEYRRDAKRVARTINERFDVRNIGDFDSAYQKYMKGTQQDMDFKENVLNQFKDIKDLPRESLKKKKIPPARLRRFKPVQYVFAGKQKGQDKIQRAVYDRSVNRYRNEKGQFVKRIR
ncbi:MAG: hypothetical protein ACQERX_02085 [Bacillota bacterium]